MSMKKKKKSRQETLWIPHDAVASSPGHPFYEELERVLREEEVVDLIGREGEQLRIALSGLSGMDVVALAQTFWKRPS